VSLQVENLPAVPLALIDEVKTFVRIDHGEDDAAIADYILSAARLCENFTGQLLFNRTVCDMLPARCEWQKLKHLPVQAITLVEDIAADGVTTTLPISDYAIDIDSDGIGWVRLHAKRTVSRIKVTYDAGLAADWAAVPTTLHQGIVRLAGYFYANRDGVDADGPPSAVTALWRPHRRLRIG